MITLSDFGVAREEAQLSNGIIIILFKQKNLPISVHMLFATGYKNDPVGRPGLSHVLEHMLMSGTKNYPTADLLANLLDHLGGYSNAFTEFEEVGIVANVGEASDFPDVCDFLHEVTCNPLFDSKVLENEKKAIVRELARYKATPSKHVRNLNIKNMFQGTKYTCDFYDPNKIELCSDSDIREAYAKNIEHGNAVMLVSGDIDMNYICNMLEGKLPAGTSSIGRSASETLPVIHDLSAIIEPRANGEDEVYLDIGFRICSGFNTDVFPLKIISGLLGSCRSSRLFVKLRQQLGLVYGVSASMGLLSDCGFLTIRTSTHRKNVKDLLKIVSEELSKLKTELIPEDELRTEISRRIKKTKISSRNLDYWVNFHGKGELYDPNNYFGFDSYFQRLSSVTSQDVMSAANKYLINERLYITALGNVSDADIEIIL